MKTRAVISLLRALLVVAVLVILLVQAAYLPWLSGEVAGRLTAEAHMRWPILALSVLGLACVQAALVCTFQLLGLVRDQVVFSPDSLRWVDGLIGAFAGGGLVCLATITYQSTTVAGPPIWMLALWAGVLAGMALSLLVWVLRTLLVQATTLSTELEMVI